MYNWACALASGKIFAETLKRCNAAIFYCLQFLYTKNLLLFRGAKLLKIRANGKKESVKDGYFFRKLDGNPWKMINFAPSIQTSLRFI